MENARASKYKVCAGADGACMAKEGGSGVVGVGAAVWWSHDVGAGCSSRNGGSGDLLADL